MNETGYWKNKFKDMEREKTKTQESLNSIIAQLEREQRITERLKKKLEMMKIQYNHLPPPEITVEEGEEFVSQIPKPTTATNNVRGSILKSKSEGKLPVETSKQ